MNAHITTDFVLAIERAAVALRDRADGVGKELAAKIAGDASIEGSNVDQACRDYAERDRQVADTLDGWAARMRPLLGMPIRN